MSFLQLGKFHDAYVTHILKSLKVNFRNYLPIGNNFPNYNFLYLSKGSLDPNPYQFPGAA